MIRSARIAAILLVVLLGGCSSIPFIHKSKTRPEPAAAAVDPGLKVAMEVVMARLRGAEDKDIVVIKDAAPEIFQLAAALMPTANRNLKSAKATPGRKPGRIQTLGDLQRMSRKTGMAANTLGAAMHGARIQNASYGSTGNAKQFSAAPEIARARSLMNAVHLGSYRTAKRAFEGYAQLKARAPGVLSALHPRVERVDLGPKGIYERLKAGPFASRAEAKNACKQLRTQGLYCAPSDYTGREPG